ncbi:MAG: carbon-nitrogen hydrolase family protein [Planctomycetes bacterium]|nr:carbon-nitrogen hydrolase family protein [Planctomycetota bacterium]
MQRVAAIQLNSNDDEAHNVARLRELACRARDRGAQLIVFPENSLYEGPDKGRRHPPEEWQPRFAELARELECCLVPGTVRVAAEDGRAYNTCWAFGPDGALLATYRKIHLFDVDVPNGPTERESEAVAPGDTPTCVELPGFGTVGLSVCYDLRFPELYRELVRQGARVVLVPASFALGTGKDHWLTLLRARAIENQVFVLAPDQFGLKPHGRPKFGKTCVIDPWGTVLGLAREVDEDVVLAELDFAHQDRIRASLPCLDHRRL